MYGKLFENSVFKLHDITSCQIQISGKVFLTPKQSKWLHEYYYTIK